jgi:hypothetical protein
LFIYLNLNKIFHNENCCLTTFARKVQLLQPALEIPVTHGVHAIPEAVNIKSGILSPPIMAVCLVNIVIDLHESSSCDYPQCGCAKELIVEHVAHRDKQHYRDDYGGTYGFSPHSQNGVVTSDVVEQYATIENGTQDS